MKRPRFTKWLLKGRGGRGFPSANDSDWVVPIDSISAEKNG